ncbi:cell wall-active antibiotics response protein LiaF [Paenibacillus chartarius]|uniref:Cell wall-active antibiotics response protein LiaF n=1 Tax=Paenibacillus chartarius TaxID=747481 RepID=A0ABV6DRE7_9BACL
MSDDKRKRNRNTALVLIGTGLFLLLQHKFGFFGLLAVALILLGIRDLRGRSAKRGYCFLGLGVFMLLGDKLSFLIAVVLIALGFFYIKSKRVHRDESFLQKQSLVDSIRWGQEPWILRNVSVWHFIGEFHMDLSLAILENKETTVVIQGVVGDVDIIVPDDIGVSVETSVTFGQIRAAHELESGLMNKLVWQSPNYRVSEHKVKLVVTYLVGDIDIKIL